MSRDLGAPASSPARAELSEIRMAIATTLVELVPRYRALVATYRSADGSGQALPVNAGFVRDSARRAAERIDIVTRRLDRYANQPGIRSLEGELIVARELLRLLQDGFQTIAGIPQADFASVPVLDLNEVALILDERRMRDWLQRHRASSRSSDA